MTTGGLELPVVTIAGGGGGGGGGTGIGAGGATAASATGLGAALRTMRFLTCRGATAFLPLTLLICTTAGRGVAATCTAPPPMMAPPQAAAQSFARAILTDIIFSFTLGELPDAKMHPLHS